MYFKVAISEGGRYKGIVSQLVDRGLADVDALSDHYVMQMRLRGMIYRVAALSYMTKDNQFGSKAWFFFEEKKAPESARVAANGGARVLATMTRVIRLPHGMQDRNFTYDDLQKVPDDAVLVK